VTGERSVNDIFARFRRSVCYCVFSLSGLHSSSVRRKIAMSDSATVDSNMVTPSTRRDVG
jgi:hypothetical protein